MIAITDRVASFAAELDRPGEPSPAAAPRQATRPAVRIMLVDDEDDFRETLSLSLGDRGFGVTSFADGTAALEHLAASEPPDLVLLDWSLGDMNGLEVLRTMRARGVTTPVVFVTGLTDDAYEEAALANGAADFIEKTRRLSILVKRLQMVLEARRTQHPATVGVRLGELELRLGTNRAFWRGKPVALTLTEFRMVARLTLTPGEDVSYRELYDIVHGKDFFAGNGSDGYRTNVRTFIKRVRRKFHDSDPGFGCIQNFPGFGYRWVAA